MDLGLRRFKFSHDRVKDAAYERIPEGEKRKTMHLKIGRCLQKHATSDGASSAMKQVRRSFILSVNQMNQGLEFIEEIEDQVDVARLNLKAAELVMKTGAFRLAASFLENGLRLSGADKWNTQYDLALQLSNLNASVLFSNGSMKDSLEQVNEIYNNARRQEDKFEAQVVHVELLACSNRLDECLEVGLNSVQDLGLPRIPRNPRLLIHTVPAIFGVNKLLKGMTDDDLLKLPDCTDQKTIYIMKHLSVLTLIAHLACRDDLMPLITCGLMKLSLLSGLTEHSPFGFIGHAIGFAVMKNNETAFRYAALALRMVERFPQDARTPVQAHGFLMHLKKPLQECIDTTLQAYHFAFSKGDLQFAGQAIAFHCVNRYIAGFPLNSLAKDCLIFYRHLEKYGQKVMSHIILAILRMVLEMMGSSDEMSHLIGTTADDGAFESHVEKNAGKLVMSDVWNFTMQTRYRLGDMDSALQFGEKVWSRKDEEIPFAHHSMQIMFGALTSLHFWKLTRKRCHLRRFRKLHRDLQRWVNQGNLNTQHLVALLDTEVLALQNASPDKVRAAYGKAISRSSRCGFVNDTALANELAGKYFLEQNDTYWASFYLRNAKDLYEEWNADAKVRQMESVYADSLAAQEEQANESNSSTRPHRKWTNFSIQGRSRNQIVEVIEAERSETL